ncbi:MAG: hypothetical protein AAF675_07415 [Pseudomonadota bacterium]
MSDQDNAPPKRRLPSKSFLRRMTSGDADPDAYEQEVEAARREQEAEEMPHIIKQ